MAVAQRRPKAPKKATGALEQSGVTLETFEAIAKPRPKQKRREATLRRRASKRPVPGRAVLAHYPGVDRAAVIENHKRKLETVRAWWESFQTATAAFETLRNELPKAILRGDNRTAARATDALHTIRLLLASSQAVHGIDEAIKSPVDLWMRHAQHDLDDDELACILDREGYQQERHKAIEAVTQSRSRWRRRSRSRP